MMKRKYQIPKATEDFRCFYPIKVAIATLIICSLIFGCKKFVTVDAPPTQLSSVSVFASDATTIAAQIGVYSQLSKDINDLNSPFYLTALASDELNTTATPTTARHAYLNALTVTDAAAANYFWQRYYQYIYFENTILENVAKASALSATVKQLTTGEAKFMRAYCYFYLVNLFGDVPLVTTTDFTVNGKLARTPKDQVYQQMVADLTDAENLLSKDFLDATDMAKTTDRVRPTSWAAAALLARVYLYMGEGHYADAENEATKVIANTSQFGLVTNLNNVFKANSTEAIWQMIPSTNLSPAGITPEGYRYILITKPGAADIKSSTISQQLTNAFEPGDQRKLNWIGNVTVAGTTYYFPFKYQVSTGTGEYSMMLRLAEQYLIRAEARVRQNKISGAGGGLADLNVIRHRAGLADYSGATDQAAVLAAIAHERQVELFTEGGDRWFDLKRTGNINTVMTTVMAAKGGSWSPYKALWPISQNNILNDINMTQTPGY